MGAKRIDLTGQVFDDLTVEEFDHNSNKLNYWKCKCICGNIKICSVNKLNQHIGTKCKCYSLSKKDLTGQKFGELTAIKPLRINKIPYWECICSCGMIKNFNTYNLINGEHKHCGDRLEHPKIDLTGQKFNKLTVLYVNGRDKKNTIWMCKCDCGNYTTAATHRLIGGFRISCGCASKEAASNRVGQPHGRKNQYDLTGQYGVGWTSNKNSEFYFDLEDYDKIKNYLWRENSRGYIEADERFNKTKRTQTVLMHRLVLGLTDSKVVVDHIFHNKNDNRKEKIRATTQRNNNKNRPISRNNKTGITGVQYITNKKKYVAAIGLNNHRYCLGYFDNLEDATKARKEAEQKYFGEYAYVEQ